MRSLIFIKVFAALLMFTVACSNRGMKKINAKDPYPSLEDQRTALARKPLVQPTRLLDSTQLVEDLRFLSSDSCEGRAPGSAGHVMARQRILQRFRESGIDSFNQSLMQITTGTKNTTNIVGWIKGKRYPEKFIVIAAHYDHLGKRGAKTYYGADDNASGAACLAVLAEYFKTYPHDYSLVFAAFDREETGLEGAFAFVKKQAAEKRNIVFNLNMDMIARSDKNEIFASGLSHYPAYKYLVDAVQSKTNVMLLMGHDTGNDMDDWTPQSDHAAFHDAKIPYLYIGVEDHPDYHKPTDTFDRVNLSRYVENCNMIAMMIDAYK